MNVCSSISNNSQNVKKSKCPIRTLEWVAISCSKSRCPSTDKWIKCCIIVTWLWWVIEHHSAKKWSIGTCYSMTIPWKHYDKWKKLVSKDHMLYESIYKKCPKCKSIYRMHCLSWNQRGETANGYKASFGVTKFFQKLNVTAQRQKYRSMEQNRNPRDKFIYLWIPYLWQRRQEYTMEKRQPL